MAQTKLANLVNPEVMADMISASLPKKIKFAPLAVIDTTLEGVPGNTITIPSFQYIGAAEDVAEGVAAGTTVLTSATKQATVKKAVKAVELTDESMESGYGDPVGEVEKQLEMSIVDKVDNDCVEALAGATLIHDSSAAQISYNVVVDAIDKFEEEDDEPKVLFIHSLQKGTLRKDPEFIKNVPAAYMTGVIGEIAGCQVVASNKVPYDATAGTYTNFIVKPEALSVYMKRKVKVENGRDILSGTDVVVANQHYVVGLSNESKAVKLTTKA